MADEDDKGGRVGSSGFPPFDPPAIPGVSRELQDLLLRGFGTLSGQVADVGRAANAAAAGVNELRSGVQRLNVAVFGASSPPPPITRTTPPSRDEVAALALASRMTGAELDAHAQHARELVQEKRLARIELLVASSARIAGVPGAGKLVAELSGDADAAAQPNFVERWIAFLWSPRGRSAGVKLAILAMAASTWWEAQRASRELARRPAVMVAPPPASSPPVLSAPAVR